MMSKDEKFVLIPPTHARLWSITIRKDDGSYRQPEREELEELLKVYANHDQEIREAWHAGFHASGEGFNGEYPFAHPGRPNEEDKEILEREFQWWLAT